MTTVPTFLLVHGAFRGGWAWRRVRPLLVAGGADVYAPSLPGAGERVAELPGVTSLDVWVDDLVALVESEDLTDLVVVGHSQGGIVTSGLVARVPDRVAALVHLDAAVPDAGERALDLLPGGAVPARDATVAPVPPRVDEWSSADLVAWVTPRLTPTPVAPSLDPVAAVPDTVAQHHVFCTGTPPGYPSTVIRSRCDARQVPYELIDSGHDAPLVRPQLVADLLLRIARTSLPSPRRAGD